MGQPLLQPRETLESTPVVHIIAGKTQFLAHLREIWHYRELIYFLGARDVKVRYKQTVLGIGWALLQPLMTTAVFWFFLGRVGHVGSDGVPYALFAFSGVLLWSFFSNSVTLAGNSVISSGALINKVYFPRMIIPISNVGVGFTDLCVSFFVLTGMMIYFKTTPGWSLLLLPYLILLTGLAALSIGLLMAALTIRYRDVRYALGLMLQFWMYATPIIYPLSGIPEKWRKVALLNPMVGIVENFRACLFNQPISLSAIGVSTLIVTGLIGFSAYVFLRMEKNFSDWV